MKKIDFPYNNFPKKGISLRKCTQKNIFAFGEKKSQKKISRLRRAIPLRPPRGGAIEFLESRILGFCPYTEAWWVSGWGAYQVVFGIKM